MNLSQRIRQLREKKNFSLNKLAEVAGVSKAYLSQLENNVSKQPSAEVLFKIASALGTTIAELLDKPVRVHSDDFQELLDKPVRVHSDDFQEVPKGLRKLIDERGEVLDIREEDVKMLMNIRYRGKQPTTVEDWEHILQTIRIVMR
jgi:transcriptional regulator with XRE-family HTH domain